MMDGTSHSPLTRTFLTDDFILQSEEARVLYHDYAHKMPILDYHCHLSPQQIVANHQFENLTDIWLKGDHYKWRAMRTLGVAENLITGSASDFEKFNAWARSVPYTMRNPLYHWTHMELKNPFGIPFLLNEKSAEYIYQAATEQLKVFTTHALLTHFNVKLVGTTDDPCDSLEHHISLRSSNLPFKMVPTFRPDTLLAIESDSFPDYIQRLMAITGISIEDFDSLLAAILHRHDAFAAAGCKASDHGQVYLYASDYTSKQVDKALTLALKGEPIQRDDAFAFKSALQYEIAKMNHRKKWVQQFHLGAIRDNNQRLLRSLGNNIGVDSMGDYPQIESMARLFNSLDTTDELAKTIVYNNNPKDNASFATMIGNFQDGTVRGKMQFGSGWWFLDQKLGMEDQLNTLSNMGILSCFVGMITDSRSFLSFPRHEYFRRILCNLIGNDIKNGELPHDIPFLGKVVQDICCFNAKSYFEFEDL
jgi:glucuronate isomerase